jgi:hypothetical protein
MTIRCCLLLISIMYAAATTGCAPPQLSADCLQSVSFGTPFKYNSGYPGKYIKSDTWVNTWADDGNVYDANDDSRGWQGAISSNMQISLLSGFTTSLTGSNINAMSSWGTIRQNGSDGADYKATGIISVNGVLYVPTTRQGPNIGLNITGNQNSQIIKSSDHGSNWTPIPPSTAEPYTSPMFTRTTFANPSFVQYGQDYQGNSRDLSNTYVYAVANDGCWNNCNSLYLGRVLISALPNLNASDWSFYQGGDGTNSANWGGWSTAQALISNAKRVGSANQVQFLPAVGCYVYIDWWYPSVAAGSETFDTSTTQWDIYDAEHPWGPWTLHSSVTWNSEPGLGLYSPNIIPKSIRRNGGFNTMIATAGDFRSNDPATGDYTLTLVPMTVTGGVGGNLRFFRGAGLH